MVADIPGEALYAPVPRPLRLPGVPQPSHRLRLRHVLVACLVAGFVWWLAAWVFRPITPETCIGFPPGASYPALEWRTFDNAWLYNGHVIGYARAEDDPCMSLTPIG